VTWNFLLRAYFIIFFTQWNLQNITTHRLPKSFFIVYNDLSFNFNLTQLFQWSVTCSMTRYSRHTLQGKVTSPIFFLNYRTLRWNRNIFWLKKSVLMRISGHFSIKSISNKPLCKRIYYYYYVLLIIIDSQSVSIKKIVVE